jgi:hypothetical protein
MIVIGCDLPQFLHPEEKFLKGNFLTTRLLCRFWLFGRIVPLKLTAVTTSHVRYANTSFRLKIGRFIATVHGVAPP